MNFIPLHVRSGFSFLKSGLTVEKILKVAKTRDYEGMGICDINSLTGVPSFVKGIQSLNKKYLVGIEIEIEGLIFSLFALSETGYRNLVKFASLFDKNITLEEVKKYFEGNAVVLDSTCLEFKSKYENDFFNFVKFLANFSKGIDDFYLGLDIEEESYLKSIRDFASSHSYKCLAFPLILYEKTEDAIAIEIVNAIRNNTKIEIKNKLGPNFFMSDSELNKIYTEEEINETKVLLEKSKFDFCEKRGELLKFPNDSGLTIDEYLKQIAIKGLEEKLGNVDEKHLDRLNYELSVISKMGYSDYFLIVKDFVDHAKSINIPVGPGRGSAVGSLTAYALHISDIDPLEYDLLFERFLNPERQTMPDIDIDFSDTRRPEVINYIEEKYGKERTAQVLAIQKIGAKQSLNDIGRIYDIPKRTISLLSNTINAKQSKFSLRENYKTNELFRNLVDSDDYYLQIVSLAAKIEGLPRQNSLHASGLVINNEPLNNGCIPYIYNSANNGLTAAFEKDYLEDQGFLKIDLLGVRNLTTIEICLDLINKSNGVKLTFADLPYRDEKAIKLVASGKTNGLFQISSSGMKNSIKQIHVDSFEDIVAVIALFRPGPMQFIPSYGKRKLGKEKITYIDPILEKILKPTYGIIVYQEQVMQVVQQYAGFTFGEADLLRRAISKKDSKKLESLKGKFVNGAIKNHKDKNNAIKVFDIINKFANYGFNKSHALAYAVVASKMAYLKANYPLEFFTALLISANWDDDLTMKDVLTEIKEVGYEILGPSINDSYISYSLDNSSLRFGLTQIKGISEQTARQIVEIREKTGKFRDFEDYLFKTYELGINEKILDNLIDSGAFDSFGKTRMSLRMNFLSIQEYVRMKKVTEEANSLFKDDEDFIPKPLYYEVEDVIDEKINREFAAIGIVLSSSPLLQYQETLKTFNFINISEAKNHNETITIVGVISSVKKILTRKDKNAMSFVKIFDDTAEIEVVVFNKLYTSVARILNERSAIKVVGRYDKEKGNTFIADEISLLEETKNG